MCVLRMRECVLRSSSKNTAHSVSGTVRWSEEKIKRKREMASPTYRVSSRLHSPAARAGGNTATREPPDWLVISAASSRPLWKRPTACPQTTWTLDAISEQIQADDLRDVFLLHTHTRARARAHTHTRTNARTRARARTHTHTHHCLQLITAKRTLRFEIITDPQLIKQWGNLSSEMLRDISWQVVTDVSGNTSVLITVFLPTWCTNYLL